MVGCPVWAMLLMRATKQSRGPRVRSVHPWLTGAVVMVLAGCSSETFSRGDSRITYEPFQPDQLPVVTGFPSHGCLDSIAGSASLREASAVAPEGFRRTPQPQDAGWIPTQLADLAVGRGRVAVVDRGAATVAVFAQDFASRAEWGRKGMGPGELQAPIAVAFDKRGDTLWVLDERRRNIVGYDFSGRFTREFRAPPRAVDLDTDEDGNFYVAHRILVASDTGPVRIVTRTGPSGEATQSVIMESTMLQPPRFVLPGVTDPRIKVVGKYVAVFYPPSGVVDVYDRSGEQFREVVSIQTCISPSLLLAYAEQRSGGGRTQTWVSLVSDVTLSGDTLLAIGSRPDAENRYGIQRYHVRTGRTLGAIVLSAGPIRMPDEVRFANGSTDFFAMGGQSGVVVHLVAGPHTIR